MQVERTEIIKLKELSLFMVKLVNEDSYISKKRYNQFLLECKETVMHFGVLEKSGVLEMYCENNDLSIDFVRKTLQLYSMFEEVVEKRNEDFISRKMIEEKEYLDNILKEVDPVILLDEDQRKVVLSDEDYSLVIAGAGAGKTTTVAAKVKYLVEKQNIDPSKILVISFTNKAVNELKTRINKELKIDCPISTFHSTGNAVIRKFVNEKMNIVDSSKLYFVLQEYVKESILTNESLVKNLILFFSSYFDAPLEEQNLNEFFNKIAKKNFVSLRSDLNEYKKEIMDSNSKRIITIQNEVLRSAQEVEIANFLYLNKIDYEYEPLYKYDIQLSRKPYTPDFVIKQGNNIAYIEHFGITQKGTNNRFNKKELEQYKKAINDKILLHRKHNTKLIYTFSSYNDKRSLSSHLKEELEKNGFVMNPRSDQEVMEKLISNEENRYIRKLISLICRFIGNFKTNGYTSEDFDRLYQSVKNVRTRLFLDITQECYLAYERYLKENNAVDFEDLINESARILNNLKENNKKIDFDYVIVDEYQDISKQRFDLVKAISKVCDAKIIAVGDDWQSIYAFSGSDISLFTNFAEKMKYAKLMKIVKTYRNSQEVIDIAGNFIQKNTSQITKDLKSPKHIEDPVIIYTYDNTYKKASDNNRSGRNYLMSKAVEEALDQIVEFNKKEGKDKKSSVLILGRFGFDGYNLEKSGLFEFYNRGSQIKSIKHPMLNITFMTAHASKGLGYDNVILINCKNETYGFPAKIEDDPVLSLVIKEDHTYDYAEERRLFYVAMTRTKNRVFFIAPEQNPSEFLLEIKKDYKNIVVNGDLNENYVMDNSMKKRCPICGYPMQYRYKDAYGLRLHICTNDPEICGFMTNEYKAGALSILKCDHCRDGYLIAKPGKDGNYFLGCTNYNKDGTGCDHRVSKKQYYELIGKKEQIIIEKPKESIKIDPPKVKENKEIKIDDKTIIDKTNPTNLVCCGYDLADLIYIILSCLVHISEIHFYGIHRLIDVLKGAKSDKLHSKKLDTIPEYGKLKSIPRDDLQIIIEWLIDHKYIRQTRHPKYPVLHITNAGINNNSTITARKVKSLLEELENNN